MSSSYQDIDSRDCNAARGDGWIGEGRSRVGKSNALTQGDLVTWPISVPSRLLPAARQPKIHALLAIIPLSIHPPIVIVLPEGVYSLFFSISFFSLFPLCLLLQPLLRVTVAKYSWEGDYQCTHVPFILSQPSLRANHSRRNSCFLSFLFFPFRR